MILANDFFNLKEGNIPQNWDPIICFIAGWSPIHFLKVITPLRYLYINQNEKSIK